MTRPYVQIRKANHASALRFHLDEQAPRFSSFPGVAGLVLNGGLSRGYADHLSEIDITFYLFPEAFERWQSGKAPIAAGITVLDGKLYDIKFVNLATEQSRDWDEVALWDASYAEILCDPRGLLRDLFSEKLKRNPEPGQAEGLLMRCWWYFELTGKIWIHRGDALQGHHIFNQAITPLVQALFVANREYIPHEKWLIHLSRSLEWKPVYWEKRLNLAMSTGDCSPETLRSRQMVIRDLWGDIDQFIRETCYPGLPVHVMQKTVYEQLKLLVEKGSVDLPDWRNSMGDTVPNGDPFYPLIRTEQDRIIVDPDILSGIGPEAMHSWHYAVLQAVRENCRD